MEVVALTQNWQWRKKVPSSALLKYQPQKIHILPQEQHIKAEKLVQDCQKPQNPHLTKYWKQRYDLFSRFDDGIALDDESWFSVTPEIIATQHAHACLSLANPGMRQPVVVDAFCGAGGNSIQFALNKCKVISIDIDPIKITYARNNARIYGAQHNIQFKVGDFFHVSSFMKADVVFLSPPWGGVDYSHDKNGYDVETMLRPKSASKLLEVALRVAPVVALSIPRTSKKEQLLELSRICSHNSLSLRIEKNFVNGKLKAITAYYWKR